MNLIFGTNLVVSAYDAHLCNVSIELILQFVPVQMYTMFWFSCFRIITQSAATMHRNERPCTAVQIIFMRILSVSQNIFYGQVHWPFAVGWMFDEIENHTFDQCRCDE